MTGEVIYRDAADMKVDEKTETTLLRNIRNEDRANL